MNDGPPTTEPAKLLRELLTWSLNGQGAMRELEDLRARVVKMTAHNGPLPSSALDLREALEDIMTEYMD